MKKHTRATPAGVPRSRSKLTREERRVWDIKSRKVNRWPPPGGLSRLYRALPHHMVRLGAEYDHNKQRLVFSAAHPA